MTVYLIVTTDRRQVLGWRSEETDAKGVCSILNSPSNNPHHPSVRCRVVAVDHDEAVKL